MMALYGLQEQFARAVLAASPQACPWLTPASEPFFDIHRNNTRVLLREALGGVFPVARMLVGDDFFAHTARMFITQMPPRSPVLLDYGRDFPDFLDALPASAGISYLGDVARLEWAVHRAYHAANAEPLEAAGLAAALPSPPADLVFTTHPSLMLVRSPFAVDQIWRIHQEGGPATEVRIEDRAAYLVVVRPRRTVEVLSFDAAGFVVVEALVRGEPLGQALDAGLSASPALAIERLLANLLTAGLFTSAAPVGVAEQADSHD
ncbi:MAG: DUF2063 domain-containing protein [Proteobacteria bacterium]|nr:MAG: DUF2063 domain-containing protein [Pseudomonadota bacterium]